MKAGDRLNATCKLRRKSGADDDVGLFMGVAGSEDWMGLKTTVSDGGGGGGGGGGLISVTTTDEHVAKKEYNGRPVTCFVRRLQSVSPLAAINSSEELNVLFEPTASVESMEFISNFRYSNPYWARHIKIIAMIRCRRR